MWQASSRARLNVGHSLSGLTCCVAAPHCSSTLEEEKVFVKRLRPPAEACCWAVLQRAERHRLAGPCELVLCNITR